jgi:GT2 family glycosyltransferase
MEKLGRGEGIGVSPSRTCVVTISYRGSADTATCLQSLGKSNVPVGIVVVDTTPMDDALEAALAFCPSFTLLRADENVGFGRGNNMGIEWTLMNSGCEYIFLLNNDATIFPDSIERLESAMADNPDVGIMAPRIAYLDDPSTLWYGGGDMDWRRASGFTPGFNGSALAPLAMTERDVTFASGCALFIRRDAAKKLRGFDPRFFMYEEDTEFCLRANENRIRIRYMPRSLILHKGQGSDPDAAKGNQNLWSVENARLPFYVFHIIRNRLLNVYLHARGRNLLSAILFFPLLIIRRAIPLLWGRRPDAVAAIFRGITDAWRTRRNASVSG